MTAKSDQEGAQRLAAAKSGDSQAVAKLLTWLERSPMSSVLGLSELWQPPRHAFRFGITGPPGAGKSTLVGGLILDLRSRGLRVGVLAVDPSSPFTKGAILGDRIRYSEAALDAGVFIRSLGTRGSLGGLSSAAFLMARAFDVCGFDVVLVETVGVGQTELDILHVADSVCVVLVPESGDSIQAMKAGLMEIADVFVINKSDRPGADALAREVEIERETQVFKTVASENVGITAVSEGLMKLRQSGEWVTARTQPARWQQEARALLRRQWEDELSGRLVSVRDFASFKSQFS